VSSERLTRLIETVRSGTRERNMGLLGTEHEVLVERVARRGDDAVLARTRDFKTVVLSGTDAAMGNYYRVRLTGTTGSTFTGEIISAPQATRALPMAVA
jgi:tRNA A37 methylthiotransferase MiaB